MDNEGRALTGNTPDKTPLVSVIVPVYNAAPYLRSSLDSVSAQTYRRFEAILVDDGSTDGSAEICREYCEKDGRFQLYRKENGGASSARNYGLDRAEGTYVYFLDSDDELVPDAIEKLVARALETGADLVFFEARTVDARGVFSTGPYDYHRQYEPGDPYGMMREMTAHREFHVGTPLFFIRRSLFDLNRLRFTEGIISEDMIMAYRLFTLAERAAHVHEYLYIRRYRPDSVTTRAKTEKNYVSAATVYREVAAFRKTLPAEKQDPGHLIRCAYMALDVYRKIPPPARTKNKTTHKGIVKDILSNDAYGDTALRLDCKGRLLWAGYKLLRKAGKRLHIDRKKGE